MHTIQLNPSVRFITNMKNGWQPYASVGMVWNLMNETNVTANGVSLPDMSVKPYVEYGVGVQKLWKDKFTGFLQAMIRNGGRNGIAITGGFRWALGQEGKPIEKVENIEKPKTVMKLSSMGETDEEILRSAQNDRKIIKQLTPNQKVAQQGGKKIIKQLSQNQKAALGGKVQNTTRTTSSGLLMQL